MDPQRLYERYRELQQYVGWQEDNSRQMRQLALVLEPHFPRLVDDFYEEIERHPQAVKVITGGPEQIERLKISLTRWLRQLFSGVYDRDYVEQRWRIGYRHVEIGLDQVYTNAALSRLRRGLLLAIDCHWTGSTDELLQFRTALNTLLDLDLALIEDAYQTEYTFRKEATERLALIGQVAGGVAHELRNPLNVIKTSVFYLQNASNASPEKVSQHLERIERQVGLADEVIVALTNFAKMALPAMRPFSVEDALQTAANSVDRPHNIEIVIQCPMDLPPAMADPAQIRIVLENLVRNGIDAMPDGGTLQLVGEKRNTELWMSVTDTGHGISREELPRIMEPFYSTKARGIGLGLPMAKAIVEKNEGRIEVESELQRGSRFTIRLRAMPAGTTGE